MAEFHFSSEQRWDGPTIQFQPADSVVSLYFAAAWDAYRRYSVENEKNAHDRLVCLFMTLSGFEAFVNCYFEQLAQSTGIHKSEILKVTHDRRMPLIKKARKLPEIAFSSIPSIGMAACDGIEKFINIRHRFMHLKHDYHSIHIDSNIKIEGLMDTSILSSNSDLNEKRLFVLTRMYMKSCFAQSGSKNSQHLIDRWTKPISRWRF